MRTPSISRGKLMAFSVKMQFTSNRHATMIHLERKNARPDFSFERSERERERKREETEKKNDTNLRYSGKTEKRSRL